MRDDSSVLPNRTKLTGAERAATILNLSERGLLVEAAANLFAHLRALDGSGVGAIAVMPIPEEGLGEAINDRLRHAAAPRGLADRFDETDRRTAIPCSDR
jgi:L-threonylcarbamoyladenylate synthase